MKRFFRALVSVLVLTLLITSITQADQFALPAADIIAPTVIQNNHVSTIEAGEDHQVLVTVTDNIAIKNVTLFYRGIGDNKYRAKTMHNMVGTDNYAVTVNAEQISADGLEYYIQATDTAGNTLLHGYAFSPVILTIINPLAVDTTLTALTKPEPKPKLEKEKSYKWLWIGLGVLAVGAAVAGGGGGGGGGDDNGTEQSTITINAPVPVP